MGYKGEKTIDFLKDAIIEEQKDHEFPFVVYFTTVYKDGTEKKSEYGRSINREIAEDFKKLLNSKYNVK